MSRTTLRLSPSLHNHLRQLAKRNNISMNQFIVRAVMEKIQALDATYLEERAARGERAKFDAALDKIPDVEPEEYDQ